MTVMGILNMWCNFYDRELYPGTYDAYFSRLNPMESSDEEDGEEVLQLIDY